MKETLLKLIENRILETNNVSGSMEQFKIDNLYYDVDYVGTIEIKDGAKSDDYNVPDDKDQINVTINEIHIRDVWRLDGSSFSYQELLAVNKEVYIL
jgi:hypothetical protein